MCCNLKFYIYNSKILVENLYLVLYDKSLKFLYIYAQVWQIFKKKIIKIAFA